MNLINKIKQKNNLPIILFCIIVLNFLPLGLPNFYSNIFKNKMSFAAGTIPTILCFGITCVLLICFLFKKIVINKETKINLIVLLGFSLILIIIQIKNFIIGDFLFKDLANVLCKSINIILFMILMLNVKLEEKDISIFMKCIIYMGIIACIYNMIFFIKEILYTLGIIGGMQNVKIKSFFGNRNQFAFFLFIAICSNFFIFAKDNSRLYKGTLILFFINLLLTMSRTGILVTGIFVGIYFVFSEKITLKTKLKIFGIFIIMGLLAFGIAFFIYPNILERVYSLFLRPHSITTLSGRTKIWQVAGEVLAGDICNVLFGVGRFKGVEKIAKIGKAFNQFHNAYIEAIVSGGVMELIYTLYLYVMVLVKIIKSNMQKSFKTGYISCIVSFLIYIIFESYGRFSIGYVDTLCMIFFVTIPLLHSNACGVAQKNEGKRGLLGE